MCTWIIVLTASFDKFVVSNPFLLHRTREFTNFDGSKEKWIETHLGYETFLFKKNELASQIIG